MLTKNINYVDYKGIERNETFYFNLNKVEITEIEVSTPGGFADSMKKAVADNDQAALFKIIKDLIFKSYGELSQDGRRFVKSEEKSLEFMQTEAFTELFMELCSDDKKASDFVNAVFNVPATAAPIPVEKQGV